MSAVLRETVTVSFGDGFEGEGWQFRQRHGDGEVRWSGPDPVSTIDVPVATPAGSTVELHVVGSVDDAVAAALTLEVNGVAVPLSVELDPAGGFRYSGTVRAHPIEPRTRLVLRVPYTLPFPKPPKRPTADPRVGVAVASVRLHPPSPPEPRR